MGYTAREIIEKQNLIAADNESFVTAEDVKENFDMKNIVFCHTVFKGYAPEIESLHDYILEKKYYRDSLPDIESVPGQSYIKQLRLYGGNNTLELIKKFPLLKATGFYENWGVNRGVYAFYSKSGVPFISEIKYAGEFDGNAESGKGRWEWIYSVFDDVSFYDDWSEISVNYHFPFHKEWQQNDELLKYEGELYIASGLAELQKKTSQTVYDAFDIENDTLVGYHGSLSTVIIPEGVKKCKLKEMSSEVFEACSHIKTIIFPKSMEEIDNGSFLIRCPNLERVVIQNGSKIIKDLCFYKCGSLIEVELPDSLEKIGTEAFEWCTSLQAVNLGGKLSEISVKCFKGCTSLKTVTITGQIKKVGGQAFSGCSDLKDIYIYSDLGNKNGKRIFEGCSNVTIHGKAGSNAELLAKENGLRFEEL